MSEIFLGAISVKAALESKYRKVEKILLDSKKHSKDISYIVSLAFKEKVPVELVKREIIEQLTGSKTTGGICGYVSLRKYSSIEELINENSFIALLEGIEDGYNYGYALRTLYAFGCSGVISLTREWNDSALICKSSAGASERMPIYQSEDIEADLNYLKSKGIKIYCAMRKDAIDMFEADYSQPVLIAIGGPLRGLSKKVLENSDQNIYIPYANDFKNALSASGAIAAISTEIYRQRR